jgi:membrane fusion protein, multidrug efflux system
VQQAQAGVDAARELIERRTLRAPATSTVASLPVKSGEMIAAGSPVITLANLDQWLVETTDLTELDVVSIANGTPAQVQIDALPVATLSGTVTHVAIVSSVIRGDVTYRATIRLNDASHLPLRWGMTVFVEMTPGDR